MGKGGYHKLILIHTTIIKKINAEEFRRTQVTHMNSCLQKTVFKSHIFKKST